MIMRRRSSFAHLARPNARLQQYRSCLRLPCDPSSKVQKIV